MNRIASTLSGLSLALLFFVASAHADSQKVTANIPFEFTFGSVSLPAGQYELSRTGDGHIVVARDSDGRSWLALASASMRGSEFSTKSLLRFATVDGHHVLFQIWDGTAGDGTELPYRHTSMELAAVDGSLIARH